MPTRRVPAADTPADDDTETAWGVAVPRGTLPAEEPSPDETAEDEIGQQLRAAFSAAPGESVRVALYRRDPRSRDLEWCEDFTPSQVESNAHDLIRESWGAGKYELRAIGRTGIKARVQIQIAEKRIANPAAPPAQNDQLAQVLGMLAQGQNRILEALTHRPPEKTLVQQLEELKLMRDVFAVPAAPAAAPAQSNASALKEMVETMRMLKEVSAEVAPEKDADPDNPMTMIGPLLDVIKAGMAGKNQASSTDMQPIALPVSLQQTEAHASVPQQSQPQPEENEPMIRLILKGAAGEMVRLASVGATPQTGGEFIYKSLPDDFVPMLSLPNWFEILTHHAPEMAPHRAWIEKAKAHADSLFAADDAAP